MMRNYWEHVNSQTVCTQELWFILHYRVIRRLPQHCWGCILLWLFSLFHCGPRAWAKWSSTEAGVIMTSLCAGEGALSVELWFFSGGLAEGGLLLAPPLMGAPLLLVVVLYRIVALLAGLRVVAVTAGEVGIKSKCMKEEIGQYLWDSVHVQCTRKKNTTTTTKKSEHKICCTYM